jgi:hypothetical protein
MTQIHQLSVSHDEFQDRLLLRLNTQDRQEFCFWLTRRMVVRLLPALTQSVARLEAAQPGMAAADSPSQQLLSELKRDAFLQTADFATPYAAPAQPGPWGDEPLLISDAQLRLLPQGTLQIIFQKKTAGTTTSCQLNLQAPLVHGMVHLIEQCVGQADWALASATEKGKNLPVEPTGAVTAPVYKH